MTTTLAGRAGGAAPVFRRAAAALLRCAVMAAIALMLLAAAGHAQEAAPADSMVPNAPADTLRPTAPPADTLRSAEPPAEREETPPPPREPDLGRDRDRIEWGAAVVDGHFDLLGTIGYRRVLTRRRFEQSIQIELAGGKKGHLTEGALSAGLLFRPLRFFRPGARIRPLLEAGPAGHLVVQVAEIEDFGESAFHAHAYLKTHLYAGLEALLGERWGLVVRGRLSVPAHEPLDYAQAAVFLR